MSTTPRTDAAWGLTFTSSEFSETSAAQQMRDKCAELETELAAAKAECKRLINQRDNLLKPLRARAEDRADAADEKVERLTSENEKLTIERDALANGSAIEIARLRAELAVAENWVEHHSKHADDLIAENVKLRAEVKRWQAEAEEMSAQRSHNANQAGRLRAEVERLKPYVSKAILTVEGTMLCSPQVAVKYNDAIARAERAEAALAFIAANGGTTHETECGPIACNGSWCAQQARAAIDAAMKP